MIMSKFGSPLGDVIGWSFGDKDVPRDERGTVTDFYHGAGDVAARFQNNEYDFPHEDLFHRGEKILKLSHGSLTVLTHEDADIPIGSVGKVIGSQEGSVRVHFTQRRFHVDTASLRQLD